jgi:arylsulfatase A-like enzyme
VALSDDELPPLPENYAVPEGEPAAIADHLSTEAVTPPGIMRPQYSERDWRIFRWIYCRLTEIVDGQISVMLQALREAGLEKDTLIAFTSDHGDMDASHRLASKGRFYEESVGVPLLMMYKGVIPPGKVDTKHLVSTGLDILPTLCDYAGIEAPSHLLGRSLRPLAEGRPVRDWRDYVASENDTGRMIRSQRYKYCSYGAAEGAESLVDLQADPGEMKNLASDPGHRETLLEHRRLLKQWCELSKDARASKFIRAT